MGFRAYFFVNVFLFCSVFTAAYATELGHCPALVRHVALLESLSSSDRGMVFKWNLESARAVQRPAVSPETVQSILDRAAKNPKTIVRVLLNRSENPPKNPAAEFFYRVVNEPLSSTEAPSSSPANDPLIKSLERDLKRVKRLRTMSLALAMGSLVAALPGVWAAQSLGLPDAQLALAQSLILKFGASMGIFQVFQMIAEISISTNLHRLRHNPVNSSPDSNDLKMTPERELANSLLPELQGSPPDESIISLSYGHARRDGSSPWPKEWDGANSMSFTTLLVIGPSEKMGATALSLVIVPD